MHARTHQILGYFSGQSEEIRKRNKIAVDVSHVSHSRTYTLEHSAKFYKEKNEKTVEQHYHFVLLISTSAELEYSATPLHIMNVSRSNQSCKPNQKMQSIETTKTIPTTLVTILTIMGNGEKLLL